MGGGGVRGVVGAPFFEIGVKNYLYGDAVVELAVAADEAAQRHGVDVLFIAPMIELRRVVSHTTALTVLASHMDPVAIGRGLTKVLPEAVADTGAHGVVVNHVEHPTTIADARRIIERARDLGLLSFVCADSIPEAEALARFNPDIINPEPSTRIGTSGGVPADFIVESTRAIRALNPRILVEQAAGISTPADVAAAVRAGADGVGVASGISGSADPCATAAAMIAALADARDGLLITPDMSMERNR